MADMPSEREGSVHYTTCPLCEATCGLEITTRGRQVLAIRGDRQDPFSKGYLCPKGYSLKELDSDPDRIRQPMIRRGDHWEAVSWEEAFAAIERGLRPLIDQHGADAVAVYLGNPNVHTLAGQLYGGVLLRSLGSRNRFSASTVDQMPKQVAVGLMYGNALSIPVPDVDRTDYLIVMGGNPLVSNGSLWTAPDMPGRLKALRERGGKLIVIDPVRTRTAEVADEHHFIRPGADALLLAAMVHTLFDEALTAPGRLTDHLAGLAQVAEWTRPFSPEAVADHCRIPAETIRRLARELAGAPRAAIYGRMGTSTQAYGTLSSWLLEVLNILTGNLDRPGGTMFPRPAAGGRNTSGTPGKGSGLKLGRYRSRVRGLPEVLGELPVACLAEEMETPGEGQIRALITLAGNPVLSTPEGPRLARGLEGLEFMVSVDLYLNETTKHAHVLLPVPSPLERSHYDIVFAQLSVRNVAHYSPAIFPLPEDQLDEWEILLRLAAIASGKELGPDPVRALDDYTMHQLVRLEAGATTSPIAGRDATEILAQLEPLRGPERMLDFLLRTGPYGDGFGQSPDGLTLARLQQDPHRLDLGPLEPRIPEVLRTRSGMIELAPEVLAVELERLGGALAAPPPDLVLVGRRDLRSNNSWMHNLPVLMKGESRCTLWVNPADAARLGLGDGVMARIASPAGEVAAPVRITPAVMPGVVSLPHGWGHRLPGTRMRVAAGRPGVNLNALTSTSQVDPLSGNAVLNGFAVSVSRV